MKKGSRRITKTLAGELAYKVLGRRKIVKEDGNGYFYKSGEILLKIWDHSDYGTTGSYSYFHLNGKWYSLPVICCTVWIGEYYSRELYYTFGLEEICYEWRPNED